MRVQSNQAETERWLYRRRLDLRHSFQKTGLSVSIPSLSAALVSYKGLLTSFHFDDYFPDLSDPAFETGLAFFHRRYSTNTYPNWTLAQPFHFSCHNGEINTIRTNRNAVHAYARSLDPALPGGTLLTPKQSDSATAPHYSSGPPNLAFCVACKTLGGKSWEKIGQIWYRAVTGFGSASGARSTSTSATVGSRCA